MWAYCNSASALSVASIRTDVLISARLTWKPAYYIAQMSSSNIGVIQSRVIQLIIMTKRKRWPVNLIIMTARKYLLSPLLLGVETIRSTFTGWGFKSQLPVFCSCTPDGHSVSPPTSPQKKDQAMRPIWHSGQTTHYNFIWQLSDSLIWRDFQFEVNCLLAFLFRYITYISSGKSLGSCFTLFINKFILTRLIYWAWTHHDTSKNFKPMGRRDASTCVSHAPISPSTSAGIKLQVWWKLRSVWGKCITYFKLLDFYWFVLVTFLCLSKLM